MKQGLLIYGCYGYTGKLISEYAVKNGLKPTLAGRDKDKVTELAAQLKLNYVAFDLNDAAAVRNHIKDFIAVLHCAGPFKYTSQPMVEACLETGTHYLDITGEYQVFEYVFHQDQKAINKKVLLMPGVGFDVVPSDCLALYLKENLPDAETLELVLLTVGGKLSHGTAITVAENVNDGCTLRRKGKLVKVPAGKFVKEIKLLDKQRSAAAISWGDISTAFRSTHIPNITVYNCLPRKVIDSMKMSNYLGPLLAWKPIKNLVIKQIKKRPAGPDEETRMKAKAYVWGEVKNKLGVTKSALLELPEGYHLTALTAVKIAQMVLENPNVSGSKTPAQYFGKDFILQFEGVKRSDLN